MVAQTNWVARKFAFEFPVGLFPCFIERLRGTPARIEEIARILPARTLTTRVNNSWSIQEHIGHLLDLESLGEQRLADFKSNATVLTAWDVTNRKTNDAGHNANSLHNILHELRTTRHALVGKLESLGEEEAGRSAMHPRLNIPMRLVDWCYFMAEHDDHHIARMTGLARGMRV